MSRPHQGVPKLDNRLSICFPLLSYGFHSWLPLLLWEDGLDFSDTRQWNVPTSTQ
ncbi:hypothetical protein BDW68DRAFT_151423 [Aspergillus falconensis]